MITTINEEMLYNGGGCWVLERMIVFAGTTQFCRISDDMFVISPVPLSYQTETDNVIAEDYWEIGANSDLTGSADIEDIKSCGLYNLLLSMRQAYIDHPKSL